MRIPASVICVLMHPVSLQVVAEATGALEWLEEKQKLQNSLRHTDNPVLLATDISKREGTLVRFAEPILNKPAPPPPKVSEVADTLTFNAWRGECLGFAA